MAGTVSKAKAKEILRHGEVHGKALTKPQRGFFGARAAGKRQIGAKSPMSILPDSRMGG